MKQLYNTYWFRIVLLLRLAAQATDNISYDCIDPDYPFEAYL